MTRNKVILVLLGTALLLAAMLRRAVKTPPRTMDLAEVALSQAAFHWDSVRSLGFTLYTPRGSFAASHAPDYRDQIEAAIPHALSMLGEPAYPAHLRLFFVGSRDEVKAITGYGYNGWTDAAARTVIHVATAECRPVVRHEIMHAVSLLLWGNPYGPKGDPHPPVDRVAFERGGWLREGLAAAAENLYGRYTYRGMAAQWQAEGTLIPLDLLVGAFYRQDDLAAYLQAGSLVEYLLQTYGRALFRQIWREGTSAFERAYGKSCAALEAEWQVWLRATPAAARPRNVSVARGEDRCPRRRT